MASVVKEHHFTGGAALSYNDRDGERLDKMLRDLIDDVTELRAQVTNIRTQYTALLAKLDDDSGVGDSDYAAELALGAGLAAQNCTKG